MFALTRVTTQFMIVAMALSLAACSKSDSGNGNPPPPGYQGGYPPGGYPNGPVYSPNGGPVYGPNGGPGYGPNGPAYGPNGPRQGGPQQNGQYRRGAQTAQNSSYRRGATYLAPEQRDVYQRPPPIVIPDEEEEKEVKPSPYPFETVTTTAKVIGGVERQAPRSSTGIAPTQNRTSWDMKETDGRVAADGGLILKSGDPLIRPQNITGRESWLGADFTDSKEDDVMTYLRHVMRDLPTEEGYQEQSFELAKRINLVDVITDVKSRTVSLTIGIKDEKNAKGVETKNLRLHFKGSLNGNTHAMMKLVTTSDKAFEFAAVVYCVDKSNTCQNTIVELVQTRNGRPCKQVFAIHRFSNFHFLPADDSVTRFEMGSMNPQFMTVMEVVANTLDANEKIRLKQAHLIRSPLFQSLALKTFSVVEGAAMFNLLFTTSTSYTQGASNEVLLDRMVIAGPLLPSFDKDLAITSTYKLLSTDELVPDPNRTGLAGKIARARLSANNGRGVLGIDLVYSSTPVEKTTFNVVTLAYDTYDMTQFLDKRKGIRENLDRYLQDGYKPQDPVGNLVETPAAPAVKKVPQKDAPPGPDDDVNGTNMPPKAKRK